MSSASLCQIIVPPYLAGPITLVWVLGIIAAISTLAGQVTRHTARLPRWLTGPIVIPATIWHELCHLAGSILAGHRITDIQLFTNRKTGKPAHIGYAYNPRNPWQTAGAALSGWAPVLISSAVLVWLLPKLDDVPLLLKVLGYYGVVLMLFAMPLSVADWKSVFFVGWTIFAAAVPVGWGVAPNGMALCQPLVVLGHPAEVVLVVASVAWVVTWGLAFLAGR